MEELGLEVLLAMAVEVNNGSIIIRKSDVEKMDLEGKMLVIVPGEDSFTITLESEEDVDVEFENQETE